MRNLWAPMEGMMTILWDGAVHRTEEFMVLVPRLKTDKPWSHRARTVGLLTSLGRFLDFSQHHLKLVQLAERGQAGLYQLKRRDLFKVLPLNQFERHGDD